MRTSVSDLRGEMRMKQPKRGIQISPPEVSSGQSCCLLQCEGCRTWRAGWRLGLFTGHMAPAAARVHPAKAGNIFCSSQSSVFSLAEGKLTPVAPVACSGKTENFNLNMKVKILFVQIKLTIVVFFQMATGSKPPR